MEQSPEQWLAMMQERADEMVRQSEQIQQQMQEMAETASDPDGAVSVTVGANGALKDLQIDQRAMRRSAAELQATILQLAGQAQAAVAGRVVSAVEPVAGAAGMDFLRSQLPPEPEPEAAATRRPAPDDYDDEPPQTFLR
ncbi:YbaB/EbfC family nucleoid-associated protein [Saccharopolyspora sp. WRP15-2]|uniref:YbaB/EbfC family nucleoid-associated protein n=1 Tax=Saccharopolyspora oryzae TaxID=2997343 RepID=A0ABT4V7R0_9PSEU|nr:YbaB/EbfC family nucleoid-associated protein [Saccharopolyspora oryzae]MDA3629446.1 YbaB/EbfC family nucleoid-associated protein [Saccharopolyspora oryzae]